MSLRRQLVLNGLLLLTAASRASAQVPEEAIRSPSDLPPSPANVTVHLKDGTAHTGMAIAPQELSVSLAGGVLHFTLPMLDRVVFHDSPGDATLQTLGGGRLRGRVLAATVRLRTSLGERDFPRDRIARIEIDSGGQRRTARRPLVDGTGQPAPVRTRPAVRRIQLPDPPAAAIGQRRTMLYALPDVFQDYCGVPTWHPRPVEFPADRDYLPR